MNCPACGSEIPDAARFCSSCGGATDFGSTPTLGLEARRSAALPPESPGVSPRKPDSSPIAKPSTNSFDGARFVPGTLLVERYRIVAMAGRGGMGEVYRAEDLKLSQTVALKFLPESIALDGAALARFHREVRIARQISHSNVCRVFDIGDADGLPFLTMEYVDGEDLATLLRRIGRLPSDKATEVARQICAGLAAAHEHGVIHRDLKPANVMIDGRGNVRITDFGLAGVVGSFEESQGGTPAYMAPEQLAGQDASVQSDIYALGLVLYEVFTGKRAFEAATLADLRRAHEHSSPTHPSQIVKEIHPLVERVILRCLEKDPAKRPASALQVAAALPGGDPLAAALAAGETPSPEMVAASGEPEGLRPWVAWAMLAGVIVSVIAVILMSAETMLYRRVPLENPPEVLAQRAREILRSAGYTEPPVDTAMGFHEVSAFGQYVADHDKSKSRWDHLETGAFVFWYRGSPRYLLGRYFWTDAPIPEAIWTNDPPLDVAGMTLVILNPLGHLTKLIVVPPQFEGTVGTDRSAGTPEPPSAPDWRVMFSAAGLDPSKWTPVQPTWTPPVYSDSRSAWTGSLVERPDVPMRIEAAAYQGKPVYFELISPWSHSELMPQPPPTPGERAVSFIVIGLLLSILVGGGLLARRNLRLGRSDRRGAIRVATLVFAASAVVWFFGAHHVAIGYELALFFEFFVFGIALSWFVWILYIALEPYVRRRWPATLVSWNRLLAGGIRDPLVGRDVLAGCLLAAFSTALEKLWWFVPSWLGRPPLKPQPGPDWQFLGARMIIADLAGTLIIGLLISLSILFILFLFRILLRKEWLAAVAFVVLFSVIYASGTDAFAVNLVFALVTQGLLVFVLIRFGLLAVVAYWIFWDVLTDIPLTTQGSAWYASMSLIGILLMAALVFYAFRTSLGGQPAFGHGVLEE